MKAYIYSEREFSVFCNAVAMCLGWGCEKWFGADGTKFVVVNFDGSAFCSKTGEPETWRVPTNFFGELEKLNPQRFSARPYEITD